MLRIFRIILSFFLTFELLFGGLTAGGGAVYDMPDPGAGAYGRYVDAFVGTGGIPWVCGMLSPAASVPFGAVRVGPDTCAAGGLAMIKLNTSGYYYEHRHMLGFSMSRLSGTGARDYGMFRVTPAAGRAEKALAYSHRNETAAPGYYAVYLPAAAALCEMTATAHAAVERYTFRTDRAASLYVDAASCLSGGETENTSIEADPAARCLTAQTTLRETFTDRYGGLTVYLYAEWDVPAETENDGTGVRLRFGEIRDRAVTLRMGLSFLSAEQAKKNLEAEVGQDGFDAVRAAAGETWEARLSAVDADADENTKTVFYTALYHAMLMPTDFTEAGGVYLGFDGNAHTAEGFTYRTDVSLWDTCRNVHALYTLLAPEIQRDCVESLLRMAEQGGVLPRWPMGAGYTGSMFGNPANLTLTESYLKGVPFDAEKAYRFMLDSSAVEHPGKDSRDDAALYEAYGYLPEDLSGDDSVSKTLEYAWEDAATATLAAALGHDEDAALYAARAQNYRNLWDPQTRYFRAKNSDGSWGRLIPHMTSFFDDIFGTKLFRPYCEGSAAQWRWSVQQDVPGLIDLFGSPEDFVKELESFMRAAAPTRAAIDPGAGYWIGNQHDMHAAYLFAEAGRPDLTQKWVRWTLKNRFSDDVDGLDGNDDGGTLSAWYVFSALGFYPDAGTDRYRIGSPCVNGATLTLGNGRTLTVRAENQSEKNVYVSSVTLNGAPVSGPFLTHEQLAAGGELVFTMSAQP